MTKPIHSPPLATGGAPSAPDAPGRDGEDGQGARAVRPVPRTGTTRAPLLVCAPLLFEARAVRRGLRDSARAGGGASGGASGAGADPPTVMPRAMAPHGPPATRKRSAKARSACWPSSAPARAWRRISPRATWSWPRR